MIALITSTLIPTNAYSLFTPETRLAQTINTIRKLREAGFSEIYLLDNSLNDINYTALKNEYRFIKILHSPQYTFKNKGLNEALLILNNMHHLPPGIPVFKISGRYYPTPLFSKNTWHLNKEKDFIGVGYGFVRKNASFSTKAYFVKNKETLGATLELAVEDMISYAKGVHGIRSGINAIKEIFRPRLGPGFQLSIEQSFARILKDKDNYLLVNKMNIEGFEAASLIPVLFSE